MQPVVIRIKNDLNDIKADVIDEFVADIELQSGDPLTVTALVIGPTSSNFKDDTFRVTMQFPDDYPYSPPTMAIVAAINHHVARSIETSMEILLQDDWKPVKTIKDILDIMLRLLHENGSRGTA